LASNFGLSRASVDRHAASHLPAMLVENQRAQRALNAQDLLTKILELNDQVDAVLAVAKNNGDHHLVLSAVERSRGVLMLISKVISDARALALQEQAGGHDSRTCPFVLPHRNTCPDAIMRDRLVQSMASALDSSRSIPPPPPDEVLDNRLELEFRGLNPDRYVAEDLPEQEREAFGQIDTEITHSPVFESNPHIPDGGRSWKGRDWA
jgi:hypothetical protein